jgi:hypothetical protein
MPAVLKWHNSALPLIRGFHAIERAYHPHLVFHEDMGVYHRRIDIPMPKQFLDGSDIIAGFNQVGCELFHL